MTAGNTRADPDACAKDSISRLVPAYELYYHALSGRSAAIEVTAPDGAPAFPDTDTTLRLPARAPAGARLRPRAWYHVALAHRALHYEAGTFRFRLTAASRRLSGSMTGAAGGRGDLEVFLGAFADRRLALQVFELLEDLRIDGLLPHRYPGLAVPARMAFTAEVAARPPLAVMAPRTAALEVLVRRSLGHSPATVPEPVAAPVSALLALAERVSHRGATVEDTAVAAVHAYTVLARLPNLGRLAGAAESPVEPDRAQPPPWPERWPEESRVSLEGDAVLDVSVARVGFRDELAGRIWTAPAPAAPNGQAVYIWRPEPEDDAAGVPVATDPGRAGGPPEPLPHEHHDVTRDLRQPEHGSLARTGPHTFVYPEWDHQQGAFLPQWCRVIEHPFAQSEAQAVHRLQRRHAFLLARLRRLMRDALPEGLEAERRTTDGDDIDFDAAVEAFADLRAGCPAADGLYQRLRRRQRDVAVGILVDASSSTGERVAGAAPLDPEAAAASGYHRWPRILDVEILACALCLTAIDAVGDASAAWAFSGTGRESVIMPVLKSLDEPFGGRAIRRMAAVKPVHATRMGAAIRHAAMRLSAVPHATKLLLVLSDGRPYDVDYGQRYGDDEAAGYAAADTAHAIDEARRRGVRPFLLTVDHSGEDYLATMCADGDYQVLDEISALPERMTGLYQHLTARR